MRGLQCCYGRPTFKSLKELQGYGEEEREPYESKVNKEGITSPQLM